MVVVVALVLENATTTTKNFNKFTNFHLLLLLLLLLPLLHHNHPHHVAVCTHINEYMDLFPIELFLLCPSGQSHSHTPTLSTRNISINICDLLVCPLAMFGKHKLLIFMAPNLIISLPLPCPSKDVGEEMGIISNVDRIHYDEMIRTS